MIMNIIKGPVGSGMSFHAASVGVEAAIVNMAAYGSAIIVVDEFGDNKHTAVVNMVCTPPAELDYYQPKKKELPKPNGYDHTRFSRRKRR